MIVIGIVGGIASGKSLVTEQLRSYGAVVLDADRIGHDVLRRESVKSQIRNRWGCDVFAANGEIDRAALASIVFDPDNPIHLEFLEELTHPLIAERLKSRIDDLRSDKDISCVVLDAPVMVKAGWYRVCDQIIFVDAAEPLRWQRASQRGWTREMFQRRESMQAPVEDKRAISSQVVDNNGNIDDLARQIQEIWNRLFRS